MKLDVRFADRIATPLGDVWAVADGAGRLVQLDFEGGRSAPRSRRALEASCRERGLALEWRAAPFAPLARALERYFGGREEAFDLPVAPEGTAFQQRVWSALRRIPYGRAISYGELARRVRRPRAARAVGRANATNPVSLVIPCHRVIGADGSLTGYGGGMDRKRALLELEGVLAGARG